MKGNQILFWKQNSSPIFKTEQFSLNLIDSENFLYTLPNSLDLFLRSNSIDLNYNVMNNLINSSILVNCIQINSTATTVKPKGKEPIIPAEEVVFSLSVPLYILVNTNDYSYCLRDYFDIYNNANSNLSPKLLSHKSNLDLNNSIIQDFKIIFNFSLINYFHGSYIFYWNSAQISAITSPWHLHSQDFVDPKVKVKPTEAELRQKYIENIEKKIIDQGNIAKYQLIIGVENNNQEEEPNDSSNDFKKFQDFFPLLNLSEGKISFNSHDAKEFPLNQEIRENNRLWNLKWKRSDYFFFSSSDIKKFLNVLISDTSKAFVPLTAKKLPLSDQISVEGGEIFATGLIDLSCLLSPGELSFNIEVPLQGDSFVGFDTSVKLELRINHPLFENIPNIQSNNIDLSSVSSLSSFSISTLSSRRKVLEELEDSITSILTSILQEYISLYGNENVDFNPSLLEKKNENFFQYLNNNGYIHEINQFLIPRLEYYIHDVYGLKGRTLGKSEILKSIDMNFIQINESNLDELIRNLLSEIYLNVISKCDKIINKLLPSTINLNNPASLNNLKYYDDEMYSIQNKINLLNKLIEDAESSNNYLESNRLHIEKLEFISHDIIQGSTSNILYKSYKSYGLSLLKEYFYHNYTKNTKIANNINPALYISSLLNRARESIAYAFSLNSLDWELGMLYVGILIECNQIEQSEEVMHQIIYNCLDSRKIEYNLTDFSNLSGYNSDELCPIPPIIYALLAGIMFLKGKFLECRKSLILANRCYIEGEYLPLVSEHGTPKRTVVLILSESSTFFYSYSLKIIGDTLLNLAKDSNKSCIEKCIRRNIGEIELPSYIKYCYNTAKVYSSWFIRDSLYDDDKVLLNLYKSNYYNDLNIKEKIKIKLLEMQIWERYTLSNSNISDIISQIDQLNSSASSNARSKNSNNLKTSLEMSSSCFLTSLHLSLQLKNEDPNYSCILKNILPLNLFNFGIKLLHSVNKYDEALESLRLACDLYSSSYLCYLVGLTYFKMEKYDLSEQSFSESLILNPDSAVAWGYYSIVLISKFGKQKLEESFSACNKAISLNLNDPIVLRELAISFMSIDQLQIAEDLIRRAISSEQGYIYNFGEDNSLYLNDLDNNSYKKNKNINPHTRKLLAEILSGQNMAAQAIDEYLILIHDSNNEKNLRLNSAIQCKKLYSSLGKLEEEKEMEKIINKIKY